MTQKQKLTTSPTYAIGKFFCCLSLACFSSLNFSNLKAQAARDGLAIAGFNRVGGELSRTLAHSEPLDSRTFRKPSNERLEQQQQRLRQRQQQFRQQYQQEWNQQQQQWKNKRQQQQQETREYRRQNQERTYQRLELQRQERIERQREPLFIQPPIQPR